MFWWKPDEVVEVIITECKNTNDLALFFFKYTPFYVQYLPKSVFKILARFCFVKRVQHKHFHARKLGPDSLPTITKNTTRLGKLFQKYCQFALKKNVTKKYAKQLKIKLPSVLRGRFSHHIGNV